MAVIPCLAINQDQNISPKDLTYLTEQYPPYNYKEDGKLQGISVDLLEMMWEKMGVGLNRSVIVMLPWTDGYQKTLKENNTVLFTTRLAPEREELFKWVGPIATGRSVLLAKADRNINITAPEDLKKYRIGGIKDDISVQMLLDRGVNKEYVFLENTPEPVIEMLKNASIDALAINDLVGIWLIRQSGANASDYRVAYVLSEGDDYYAFNKETPDSLLQEFQQALDYIKNYRDKDGTTDYQKILYKSVPLASPVAAESEAVTRLASTS